MGGRVGCVCGKGGREGGWVGGCGWGSAESMVVGERDPSQPYAYATGACL